MTRRFADSPELRMRCNPGDGRVPTHDEIERLLDVLIRRIVRTVTRAQALVAGPEEEGAQP